MDIAGTKLNAHAVITMETSSVFLRSQGDFQKDCFFKGWLGGYPYRVYAPLIYFFMTLKHRVEKNHDLKKKMSI